MKKILIILSLVSSLCLTMSCSKEPHDLLRRDWILDDDNKDMITCVRFKKGGSFDIGYVVNDAVLALAEKGEGIFAPLKGQIKENQLVVVETGSFLMEETDSKSGELQLVFYEKRKMKKSCTASYSNLTFLRCKISFHEDGKVWKLVSASSKGISVGARHEL